MVNLKEESDEGLFTYIAFADSEPNEANAALHELMCRYQAILQRLCVPICQKFSSLGLTADELVLMAFSRASDKASTYKGLPDVESDSSKQIAYTAAWLFRIAQNILFDAGRQADRELPFEKEISEPEEMSALDLAIMLVSGEPKRFCSADTSKIAIAIESLNEKQLIVLVWTVEKRRRSISGKYMNRGSAAELARMLDTTEDNVRQIRLRALNKISALLKTKAKR